MKMYLIINIKPSMLDNEPNEMLLLTEDLITCHDIVEIIEVVRYSCGKVTDLVRVT